VKEIKAIIRPFMLDAVQTALHEIKGLPGCTVSQVQGYGRSDGKDACEEALRNDERTKLEIVVPDPMVKKVIKVIQEKAHTGKEGDGKIYVIQCVDVIRIRTGEHGQAAI